MNSINQNLNNYELFRNNTGFRANEMPSNAMPNYMLKNAQTQDVELPDMYYMPENYKKPKTFKDKLKSADVLGIITQWFEHPLLMLGTCAGISVGIDAFDKSCNKEYEKSIIGKAAKLGDRIENSKFIQSDPSQKALKGIKSGWGRFKELALKNSVIYAMVKTPSQPEMSMPKDELKHTDFRIVNKFKEISRNLDVIPNETSGLEGFVDKFAGKNITLKHLALDKEEIEYLKKTYNVSKTSKLPESECVNRINLKRIGKTESEISEILAKDNATELVKEEIFNKMGLTKDELQQILKDENGETIKLVKKAANNLKGLKVNSFPLMGKLKFPGLRQPLANVESFENVFNRAHSLSEGAETKTGRFMSKLLQKIHRGFTFGGTKFGVMLFVAPLLVETMINTKKADRKEKVGTAVGGAINAVSWVFTFPLVLAGIHAYGGIQYAGMGKDKVDEYRRLVNEFNAKAIGKQFATKDEYKAARKELKKRLKELRKVENQSLFTSTLRGVSHFTKADLLSIESYRGENGAMNLVRQLPDRIVNKFGYSAARFMVFMLVGMPLVDKVITKCTGAVFGNAYDAEKEREHEDAKERQEEYTMNDLRARMIEAHKNNLYPKPESVKSEYKQPEISNPAIAAMLNKSDFDSLTGDKTDSVKNAVSENQTLQNKQTDKPDELNKQNELNQSNKLNQQNNSVDTTQNTKSPEQKNADKASNVKKQGNNAQPNVKRDNYTYIPSSENVLNKTKPQDMINKYIPAQTGINLTKTFDNSGLEAALRRADRAEKRAISVLAGNFGSAE